MWNAAFGMQRSENRVLNAEWHPGKTNVAEFTAATQRRQNVKPLLRGWDFKLGQLLLLKIPVRVLEGIWRARYRANRD